MLYGGDNMQELIQMISTVGFPIACCCFLLWQGSKQDQYNREQMDKLRDTINQNTKSIEELGALIRDLIAERRRAHAAETADSRKG